MASGSKSRNLADAEADADAQVRASGSGRGIMSRRRKAPDSVTPNACTNCKRARAKVIDILFESMRHRTWCDDKIE